MIDFFIVFLILSAIILLAVKNYPAAFVFAGVLTVIIIAGIVTPSQALVGFSNEGMLTVGALYIVAAGLKETGGVQLIIKRLLNKPNGIRSIQIRIITPIMGMSAFLNNTPIVASFIPALQEWGRKYRVPVSKLLIPLSYAAILGGTCTLIGTSTNLIINGLLIEQAGADALGIFEPAWIGIPCAIVGFLYLALFGNKLLPERGSGFDTFKDPREYTIEMIVQEGSPLPGKTVEEAGLRNLPGLYLVEIYRQDHIIAAVDPEQKLKGGDRLIFTGIVDSIVDLQQIKGLKPATDQIFKLNSSRRERLMIEAVVSPTHPVNGKTIKNGRFRNIYDAVVLAVSRNGERVKEKVGDIRLKTGDTLLLEAHPNFLEQYKNSSDYYLTSGISNSTPPNYKKSGIAWGVLGVMVSSVAFGLLPLFQASLLSARLILVTRCCRASVVKAYNDCTLVLVIA